MDDRLPAVPHERLAPDAIRQRFAVPPAWEPEVSDDRFRLSADEPRAAAVLVPLVAHPHGASVLLTRRTEHLQQPRRPDRLSRRTHRADRPDAGSHRPARVAGGDRAAPLAGADPRAICPIYRTGTGFVVTPVVGLVDPQHTLRPDPNEVAEAFEVPLAFLMDPANHQRRLYRWGDAERMFFAMPWRAAPQGSEYFIWGATAAMLRNLYRFLSA